MWYCLVKIATGNRVYITFLSVNYNSNNKLGFLSWSDTLLWSHVWRRAHSIPLVWTNISLFNEVGFSYNYAILGKIFYSANLIGTYSIVNYLWYILMALFLMMTYEYFRVLVLSHQYWVSSCIAWVCTVKICYQRSWKQIGFWYSVCLR